jgi:hypothetical protein
MNYLNKLKEKCNGDKKIYEIIDQIFEKLLEFGYVSRRQIKKLEKKLYNNIDTILIGNDVSIDYKTGYYDAVKKELYIKDLTNIEAVYLRIIYILTTTEISNDNYVVGYSDTILSKSDYKIRHQKFGINRAVVSNLVCRLLYTTPTTLSIMPTYRTYENDFLGNKISSDNDIYFLEGKLLRELCYISNMSEESLYSNLFISPKKYLVKFFKFSKFENHSDLLTLLDNISKDYSNYNKLVYLNRLLNNNYLNIKKNILNDKKIEFKLEQTKIKLAIKNSIIPLIYKDKKQEENENFDVETSLSEEINKLEEKILNNIAVVQNIFVDILINSSMKYSNIEYAVKLKELDKILIVTNQKLKDEICNTISNKLLSYFENTSSNLIDKMKYSLVNEILSSDKYVKIYKNMAFHKLNNLELPHNTELMAITVDNSFMQLVKITNLNLQIKDLNNNTENIKLDNLGYLLSNPASNKDIHKIEKIFTGIRNKFTEFNNVPIENMFMSVVLDVTLVVVMHNNSFSIIEIIDNKTEIECKKTNLSDAYNIFNLKDSNLPVLYNKKETRMEKILSFFLIFS